jgi:hypothetical protein
MGSSLDLEEPFKKQFAARINLEPFLLQEAGINFARNVLGHDGLRGTSKNRGRKAAPF